jgi:hypothetical protein
MMTPPVSGIRIYSSLGRWIFNITPGFSVTPVLPGGDNVNEFNQPGGLAFQ